MYVGLKFDWTTSLLIYRLYRWADGTNAFYLNWDYDDVDWTCPSSYKCFKPCGAISTLNSVRHKSLVFANCMYTLDKEQEKLFNHRSGIGTLNSYCLTQS